MGRFVMRCSRCRTRNTFKVCPTNYRPPRGLKQTVKQVNRALREIGGKRCRDCGHTSFYLDKERTFRLPCHCVGAYHWGPHRPGSPHCSLNPNGWFNRARRADPDADDEDIVIELSLSGLGGRTFAPDVIPF